MKRSIEWFAILLTIAAFAAEGQLTRNHHKAVWLPDGSGLVFMSDRSLDWELYTINLDGSGLRRLTNHVGWDGYASVNGDASAIAYDRGGGERTIVLMNPTDGTESVLISRTEFTGGSRWLPGDEELLFVSEMGGNRDIYRIHKDGTHLRNVTSTPGNEHDPSPSPDGRRLLMAVNLDGGSALDVMNLDGTGRSRLVTSTGYLYGAEWSPDGKWITFNTDEDGDQEIYKMRSDGSQRSRLTENDFPDHQASWSPDGTQLVFTSERNGREEIFLMDPDGGHVVRLATD